MSEMPLRKYFMDSGSVVDLTSNLGIGVKPHPEWPNLLHFSYSLIDSPKDHPIVKCSRGTILDSTDNWKVICYPFNRFANYGESWADPIDWNTAKAYSKVDGTLCLSFLYKGKWNFSTKGSPDAGGNVGDFPYTFKELFWKTFKENHSRDYEQMYSGASLLFKPEHTVMLEFASPMNRIICEYPDCGFTLIGVRNNITLKEYSVSPFSSVFPTVKEFLFTTLEQVIHAATEIDPREEEGFVICDANFNRVKIKSESYVALHHLKEGFGQRRIIRLIQLREESEILAYFPDYRELFEDIKNKIDNYISTLEREYDTIKHIKDRKEFALEAVKTTYSGAMFAMYLGKTSSIRNYILHEKRPNGTFCFPEEKIEQMIGLKERVEVLIEE